MRGFTVIGVHCKSVNMIDFKVLLDLSKLALITFIGLGCTVKQCTLNFRTLLRYYKMKRNESNVKNHCIKTRAFSIGIAINQNQHAWFSES